MSTLSRALEIALSAHKGQKDKAGSDYIFHPLRVMAMGNTEEEKICGLLHDVLEDSDTTLEHLKKEGFSDEVLNALQCLTKENPDEDYDKFFDRVMQNPLAVKVKINDLLDNMNITRFSELSEKDLKRLNKYLKAYHKLKSCKL
ncbi:MAG: phosphohydrolase [Chitinophagales bacterium]|nr:phosphohydrolase [Chitinophagales bacterium]MDW8273591.1 phosphohydrolase [Chitinophagales bacterium]